MRSARWSAAAHRPVATADDIEREARPAQRPDRVGRRHGRAHGGRLLAQRAIHGRAAAGPFGIGEHQPRARGVGSDEDVKIEPTRQRGGVVAGDHHHGQLAGQWPVREASDTRNRLMVVAGGIEEGCGQPAPAPLALTRPSD